VALLLLRLSILHLLENKEAVIARFFGLMPMLNFFTRSELEKSLTDAGFQLEHQYQPTKESAVFIVAKKI